MWLLFQDRYDCHCDDSYGEYGPDNVCNMYCASDPATMCGGALSMSVLLTDTTLGEAHFITTRNHGNVQGVIYSCPKQLSYGYEFKGRLQDGFEYGSYLDRAN